jgi:hypothetical protein
VPVLISGIWVISVPLADFTITPFEPILQLAVTDHLTLCAFEPRAKRGRRGSRQLLPFGEAGNVSALRT